MIPLSLIFTKQSSFNVDILQDQEDIDQVDLNAVQDYKLEDISGQSAAFEPVMRQDGWHLRIPIAWMLDENNYVFSHFEVKLYEDYDPSMHQGSAAERKKAQLALKKADLALKVYIGQVLETKKLPTATKVSYQFNQTMEASTWQEAYSVKITQEGQEEQNTLNSPITDRRIASSFSNFTGGPSTGFFTRKKVTPFRADQDQQRAHRNLSKAVKYYDEAHKLRVTDSGSIKRNGAIRQIFYSCAGQLEANKTAVEATLTANVVFATRDDKGVRRVQQLDSQGNEVLTRIGMQVHKLATLVYTAQKSNVQNTEEQNLSRLLNYHEIFGGSQLPTHPIALIKTETKMRQDRINNGDLDNSGGNVRGVFRQKEAWSLFKPRTWFESRRKELKYYDAEAAPGGAQHIDHMDEAMKIGKQTQFQRLKGAVQGLFGNRDNKYYPEGIGKDSREIRDAENHPLVIDSPHPTSHWYGHATLFLDIPLTKDGNSIHVNILTDPVEGDIQALAYPRKTNPSHEIEALPISHVILISHNHRDHLDVSTLKKLVKMQPFMIVPEGDREKFTKLGFQNVQEQDWWDKTTLQFEGQGGATYDLNITAVPANHWSNTGLCDTHESNFNGYVISGDGLEGDIYFAGDTAFLKEGDINAVSNNFNIKYIFEPGGPDRSRDLMQSTHQASADALRMFCKLILQKHYNNSRKDEGGNEIDVYKEVFLEKVKKDYKVIFMHTATFKLGNLKLRDTPESISNILKHLRAEENLPPLEDYEQEILAELVNFCGTLDFFDVKLTPAELADILETCVLMPLIGERTTLAPNPKKQEA